MKLITFITISILIGIHPLIAQESTLSAGGEANGPGGTASYSIGQTFYNTQTGEGGIVSEGIQQAYEIFTISVDEEETNIHLNIEVYPNPTTDYLNLEVSSEFYNSDANKTLYYNLFNLSGKLINKNEVYDLQTKIDMSTLLPSTYFLRVINNEKEIKVFKIIKH